MKKCFNLLYFILIYDTAVKYVISCLGKIPLCGCVLIKCGVTPEMVLLPTVIERYGGE